MHNFQTRLAQFTDPKIKLNNYTIVICNTNLQRVSKKYLTIEINLSIYDSTKYTII